jgi:sugar phosphate isomerase/epimerase
MKLSRRDLAKFTFAALPPMRASASVNSAYKGVQFGICSYSFRGLGLDELIRQMTAVPMGQLELESVFVEPAAPAGAGRGVTPERREALRRWRLTVGLDEIRAIRHRLDDAGIDVYAYNIPVNKTFTEEELDRVFRIARLLGAQAVNSATPLPVVPLLAAAAERNNMRVGLHPSGGPASPDAIGSGDSYRKALAISPRIGANPDLNGWKAWGPDPLAFIREIGSRITTMHTHDSKPAEPRAVAAPFGEGTNPVVDVLRLIQKEKFTFVAMLERIYNVPEDGDNVVELRKSLSYCQKALAT